MTSIKDRLRALQRQIGKAPPAATPVFHERDLRSELRRLLRPRERSVPKPLVPPVGNEIAHGVYFVEHEIPAEFPTQIAMPWGDPDNVERERLVCFDTETTGLAGGVGTKAFMIGSAQWKDGLLCIRQWYLTALAGEHHMLRLFADSLPASPVFVSYNGRSYDAPLLKGRYRIHRQRHPFEERRHVDC